MKGYTSRKYAGIPVGLLIRRDIGKTWIYRVRRGRGIYGEKLGETIQDRYAYFVPDSINNSEGEPYRRQWTAAVHKWRYGLTVEQKKEYNDRATRRLHMSGFNLFMRAAMKGEVEMFVDRGDPSAWDLDHNDLTTDGNWHDLDLSSIVAAGAKGIALKVNIKDDLVDQYIYFRKKGNTFTVNSAFTQTQVANIWNRNDLIVACDTARKIQYYAANTTFTGIYIVVKGWWT